jgi:hypothetical protein
MWEYFFEALKALYNDPTDFPQDGIGGFYPSLRRQMANATSINCLKQIAFEYAAQGMNE